MLSRRAREVGAMLWRESSPFVRQRLAMVLLLVATVAAVTALAPLALKAVVDAFDAQPPANNAHLAPPSTPSVTVLLGLYVLALWLARIMGEVRGFLYARAERRLYRAVGERLFDHLMRLPLRYHLDRQTGAVSQTLTNGLEGLQMVLHDLIFTYLPVLVELATIAIVLARLDQPVILALFGIALLGYGCAFARAVRRIETSARDASAALVNEGGVMTDGLLNYETVKYFAAEPAMRARVSGALTRTEREWVGFYRRYAVNGIAVATLFGAFMAAASWYAAHEVSGHRMSLGGFVLVNAYVMQIVQPVELLGYALQRYSQGMAFLEKLLAILREPAEPAEPEGSERPVQDQLSMAPGVVPIEAARRSLAKRRPASVYFEAVSLAYAPGRQVLRDVSFAIPAGHTLGVVGASGAGKSSLVRLLVRFLEPETGIIRLDRVPIADLPLSILRQAIAVVPQDTVLFNDTIGANIAFGRPEASQAEIQQAARLAHLHDFVTGLPDGYATAVGERGAKLSGGEKQRLSIARAVLKRPRVYVFDEATSSLDSRTERDILDNLREIARSMTTLVIAHRLSTVVEADAILVLDQGVVAECGTHAQLLQRRGTYATLWEAQHASY